jgi:hypothetical protein
VGVKTQKEKCSMENERKPGQNPQGDDDNESQRNENQYREPSDEQKAQKRAPGQNEGDREKERKRA